MFLRDFCLLTLCGPVYSRTRGNILVSDIYYNLVFFYFLRSLYISLVTCVVCISRFSRVRANVNHFCGYECNFTNATRQWY